MNIRHNAIALALALAAGLGATAQTLSQARTWYARGEYAKAKPVFRKYVRSQPGNGNYNLWYGVCCLYTGEEEAAVSYLENAVKRRIPSGQLYLTQAYNAVYRFDEAVETCEAYLSDLQKRKRDTAEAESLLKKSRQGRDMMRGVEQVCVIDSFVVDKASFLQAYRISPESGRVSFARNTLETADGADGTVYETELSDLRFYSQMQPDSTLAIVSSRRTTEGWSKARPVGGNVNADGNACYPFMMPDGVTLYYASDGSGSLGGYDIFVTRYNTDDDTFLASANVGMPFNSPYNDYLYAIDEFSDLGWFASDRYQPANKVCVYVFIPNASKRVYDHQALAPQQLIGLAKLRSIRDTWTDMAEVNAALRRMKPTTDDTPQARRDFEFVIDDQHCYYSLADFRSQAARQLFQKYRQAADSYEQQRAKLDKYRSRYNTTSAENRTRMQAAILDLEKQVRQLFNQKEQLAKRTRNEEILVLTGR